MERIRFFSRKIEDYFIVHQVLSWCSLLLGLSFLIVNGIVNMGYEGIMWVMGLYLYGMASFTVLTNVIFLLIFLLARQRSEYYIRYESFYKNSFAYIVTFIIISFIMTI